MKIVGKSTRFHERVSARFPLAVRYRENDAQVWQEETQTEQLTVCGIGLTLSHPVEPKRLIRLISPLPKKFRLFDYATEKYDVWGMIVFVNLIESKFPDMIRLFVGTALIGGKPPQSFRQNPETYYDLNPFLQEDSFWDAREMPRRAGRYMRSSEERFSVELSVKIETIDENGRISEKIEAKTLNISEGGAAVIADLKLDNPKYVLIKYRDEVALLAVVRGQFLLEASDLKRLHLEFISGKAQAEILLKAA